MLRNVVLVLFLALQPPEENRYYESIGVYRKRSYVHVSHFKMTTSVITIHC